MADPAVVLRRELWIGLGWPIDWLVLWPREDFVFVTVDPAARVPQLCRVVVG
jgi:hypothetical protein